MKKTKHVSAGRAVLAALALAVFLVLLSAVPAFADTVNGRTVDDDGFMESDSEDGGLPGVIESLTLPEALPGTDADREPAPGAEDETGTGTGTETGTATGTESVSESASAPETVTAPVAAATEDGGSAAVLWIVILILLAIATVIVIFAVVPRGKEKRKK